jgi:uncharacterized phage protein gp47/JayE
VSSYGVTETGFVKKDLETIKVEVEASLRSGLGENLKLLATGVLGQIVGIVAEREAENWDVMEAVYNAMYPSSASGHQLEGVCSITGVKRLQATKGTVTATCSGAPSTALTAGRIVSVDGSPTSRWLLLADATIAAADAWQPSAVYAAGDKVTNDGKIYICAVAGTSAGSVGPTGNGTAIVDNTVTWRYAGDGTGFADATFECETTGPVVANAWTLTVIETPASGWEGVANENDADVGRDLETEAALRLRREQLLRSTGNAALDAVVAKVAEVEDVSDVWGFENVSDITDAAGLPPHSIEVLVRGGADQDIIDAIWASKAGGIETYGGESGTAIDARGKSHTLRFSRPAEVPIYAVVELTSNADYPADGDTQVKNAIKAHGESLGIGADVITSAIYESIFSVSGVVDVTRLWISETDPPTGGANITIADRALSTWDTGDIDVTAT